MYINYLQKRCWAKVQRPEDDFSAGGGAADDGDFDLSSAIDEVNDEIGGFNVDESDPEGTPPAPQPPTPPAPGTPPTPPGTPEATPPAPGPVPPSGTRVADITKPPSTWKPEATAGWETLSEAHRAEIHRREESFHAGIEQYKADAAFARPMKEVLAPYLPTLQQYGIEPAAQVRTLMQAHHTLALGSPDAKKAMLLQVAKDYQIDLGAPSNEPAFTDPEVNALRDEVNTLRSQLNGTTTAIQQERASKIRSEVEAFAKDPANEHFDECSNEIAVLLKATPGITLKQAYDTAIWANPVVRQKLLDKQAADAEAARKTKEEADRKEAEKAATAKGVNVKNRAKAASATGATGSIDDTLKETLAAINARG